MIKYILIPFLAFGLLWSCSDSDLLTPGDEFLPELEDGSYIVDIDNQFNDFSNTTGAISNPNGSQINGESQIAETISIMIPQSLGVGTYDQTEGAVIILNLADGIYTNLNEQGLTPFWLKITEKGSGKVSGDFSGTVYNLTSGEVKTLTNGHFVKILFEESTSSNAIFKADFDDLEKDFSTNAKAEGIVTAALISGQNTETNQELSITIPGGIAIGTFTEENQVLIQVNLGTSGNPADSYSNFNPADGTYLPVTLEITDIVNEENGEVTGNFSGQVAKFVNGQPTGIVEITNGQIKVPIVIP